MVAKGMGRDEAASQDLGAYVGSAKASVPVGPWPEDGIGLW